MNLKKHAKIFQTASLLAELLRTCPEYTHYINARERLFQDPVNKRIFMELRQKQLALADEPRLAEAREFDPKQKFVDDLLMSVALDPVVNDFLNAEYNFGRIIEHIGEIFEPILPYNDLEDEDVDELLGWLETGDKQAPNESTYLN